MKFLEAADLIKKSDRTGYLAGLVRAGRSGIQIYRGAELGLDQEFVSIYRPPEEVFAKDSLATLPGKPVTVDHPWVDVNSSNWTKYARGYIGEGVLRDGEWMRIPVMVNDSKAIAGIESGEKSELSFGYDADVEWSPGVTDQNESYDGVMRHIRYNHLSLVNRARAGSAAKFGDEFIAQPISDQKKLSTQTISKTNSKNKMPDPVKIYDIEGRSIETVEQAIALVKEKNSEIAELTKTIAARDSELAKRDSKISDLEQAVEKAKMTDEEIAERVIARATLIADARSIMDAHSYGTKLDLEKLPDAAIKTEAVIAARGKSFLDGKSDAYMETAYDIALVDAKNSKQVTTDDFRKHFQTRSVAPRDDDGGQSDYSRRISEAWKTGRVADATAA